MRYPSWIISIGLLCGTIFFFFGGIELALRLTGLVKMEDYTPPIYEKSENPRINYQLKSNMKERAFRNTVTTNSLGFRSPEPDPTKSIIVVLGDSITFGYGVQDEETLAANLQKLLPAYAVQNAGVPGYNIRQEASMYEEKIASLDPEAMILIFYWNDFDLSTSWLDPENVLRPEGWTAQEKQCTPIEHGILSLLPGRCFLDFHSAFYRALKEFANTRTALEERDTKRLGAEVPSGDTEEEISTEDLQSYERELEILSSEAPVKRLFVIWPDASALHAEARTELALIVEQQGFDVLDLYEYFGNSMETLDWDYIHPSPSALVQAAEIIHDHLE